MRTPTIGARAALAILVAMHIVAGALLLRLQFNNAPELYFPEDTPVAALARELRTEFPNDETLIGMFRGEELYGAPFLAALDRVGRHLEAHPLVDRVFSIANHEELQATSDGLAIRRLIDLEHPDAETPIERRDRVLRDRFAPGWLAARNGESLLLIVRAHRMSESRERAALESAFHDAVLREGIGDRLVAVTGLIALDTAETRSIVRDSLLFTPMVMLLGLGLLRWIVGRWRPVAIGAAAISAVVLAAVALLAAMGAPYTLVTAMVPTLLAAYTSANLLHLYAALQRVRLQHPARESDSMRIAQDELRKPALFNVLSTAAGVLSLVLVPIPPIQMFGVSCAFGTLLIYPVVFVLVPALLRRWDCSPPPGNTAGFTWAKRVSGRVAVFSVRHAGRILAATAALGLLMLPVAMSVRVESDLLEFFSPSHPLIRSTRMVESEYAGIATLEIIVDGPGRDAFTDGSRLRAIKAAQHWLATLPEVDRTVSVVDLIEDLNRAFNDGDEAQRRLPDGDRQIGQLLLLDDGRDLAELLNRDRQRARILVNVRAHGANAIQAIVDRIESHFADVEPPDLRWRVSGHARLFSDLEDQIVTGQKRSFLGAFGQVFLMLVLLLRSLPAAVIGMIPNLAPLFFVFVVMGASGIDLDTSTVLIASVVLGITVDDTIHFFHSYRERRRKGFAVIFSLIRSFGSSGRAVVAISLLLVAQFLVMTGSQFRPTAHYGLLAATGLLAGQILELLLLPALIALWERFRGNTRTRR